MAKRIRKSWGWAVAGGVTGVVPGPARPLRRGGRAALGASVLRAGWWLERADEVQHLRLVALLREQPCVEEHLALEGH
ncbi:hypothetical protein HOK021_21340 [Streptomyces hygroscopicus]|nr:hypothetical protein HOK021_21340 [Streptomyces hygroscopicus]